MPPYRIAFVSLHFEHFFSLMIRLWYFDMPGESCPHVLVSDTPLYMHYRG